MILHQVPNFTFYDTLDVPPVQLLHLICGVFSVIYVKENAFQGSTIFISDKMIHMIWLKNKLFNCSII